MLKPASSAACVATALKFALKRLSSFSRSSIVFCLTVERSSSLSAASIAGRGGDDSDGRSSAARLADLRLRT